MTVDVGFSHSWRRRAALVLVIQFVSVLVGLATDFLVARWAGVETYGAVRYYIALSGVLAVLGTLGLPGSAMRFVPTFGGPLDSRLTAFVLLAHLASGVVLLGAGIAGLSLSFGEAPGESLLIGWAFPLLVLWMGWSYIAEHVARARGFAVSSYLGSKLVRSLAFLAGTVLALRLDRMEDGVLVLLAAASFLAGWAFMIGRLAAGRRERRYAIWNREAPLWFRTALPLLVVGGASLALQQIDLIMLGQLGLTREVGVYAAAARVAVLVSFVLSAAHAVVAPRIVRMAATEPHDWSVLGRRLGSASTACFWSSVVLSLMLWLSAPFVFRLLGREFAGATAPLAVLLLGRIAVASIGVVALMPQMLGGERASSVSAVVALAVAIALNALWIPRWGAMGAALATVLSYGGWMAYQYHWFARRCGFQILPWPMRAVAKAERR